MTTESTPSGMAHLQAHHGDFANFRDAMIQSSAGRFGPIWWGVFDTYIEQPTAVVDLGTGPGLLLPMLRERLPQAQITAVEIQPEMLAPARENAARAGARLLEADLTQPLPLADGCADLVTCVMVFHELPHPPPLMAEMARLLKPGGRLLLYDWLRRDLRHYLDEDQELTPETLQHFREHCLFSLDDLEFLAERAGLRVLESVGRRGGRFAILALEKV